MHRKNRNTSLCYGFIFNLLVALCTIAFMCYFLYRFDTRLLSLERRLWNIQHDKGVSAVNRERLTLFKKGNRNKRRHFNRKNLVNRTFQHGFLSEHDSEKPHAKWLFAGSITKIQAMCCYVLFAVQLGALSITDDNHLCLDFISRWVILLCNCV